MARILNAAKENSQELKWHIALLYGLRQAERLGLTWGDIDLDVDTPMIKISMQLQRQTGRGLIRVPVKTTESNRGIPLTEVTVNLLKSQRAAYDLGRAVHGQEWNADGYVFWNSFGRPSDSSRDQEEWRELLKSASVEYKSVHVARKTFATLLDSTDAASRILGHSNQSVTMKHYRNTQDAAKLTALNNLQQKVTKE